MSLRGTLDTLAVPDLLTLLAATKRSGELVVRDHGFEGRVWLAEGGLVKADVPDSADLVDAVFMLLRLEAGDFSFEADAGPFPPSEATSMQEVLSEAEVRLTEWLALDTAVPNLAVRFRLVPDPVGATVTITAGEWRVLAALAEGNNLRGAMEALGLNELDARRAVKKLLDTGLLAKAAEHAPPPPIREPDLPGPAPEALVPEPDLPEPAPPEPLPPAVVPEPAPEPDLTGPAPEALVPEPDLPEPAPPQPEPEPEPAAVVPEPAPPQPEPAAVVPEPAPTDAPGQAAGDASPDDASPGDDAEEGPPPPIGEDEPVSRSLLFRYLSGESF